MAATLDTWRQTFSHDGCSQRLLPLVPRRCARLAGSHQARQVILLVNELCESGRRQKTESASYKTPRLANQCKKRRVHGALAAFPSLDQARRGMLPPTLLGGAAIQHKIAARSAGGAAHLILRGACQLQQEAARSIRCQLAQVAGRRCCQ